jgi:hypothetical protein
MPKCDCEHTSHWAGPAGMTPPEGLPTHTFMSECEKTTAILTLFGTYNFCDTCLSENHPYKEAV